jgi:hypothetical protein
MSYASTFLNELSLISESYKAQIDAFFASGLIESEVENEMRRILSQDLTAGAQGITEVAAKYKIEAETTAKTKVESVMGIELPKESEEVVGDTPEELSNHYVGKLVLAGAATAAGIGIVAATTLGASIPFVNNGSALARVWDIPILRSTMDVASDVLFSHYNMVQRQLIQRHLFSLHKPIVPEAYRIVDMYAAGVLSDDSFKQAMAENGLSAVWADRYGWTGWTALNPQTVIELLRRGAITDADVIPMLRLGRFRLADITAMLNLKDVIPPLNDLINMAVKEAFGDHTGEAQIPELHSWAKKMGLSDYFTDAYWYAHWERIPLQQMYDNLYRGYWDKDRFMNMLRIKDLHPDDREALFNVAYQVPAIRELGYGYDVGLYKREDIVKFRRYGGLSPEDAEKAADALILYRNEAEKNAVLTELMYLYAMGKMTKDQFIARFKEKGVPEPTIALWIERADAYTIRISKPSALEEGKIISSAEALAALKNGLQGDAEARAQLKALDWDDDRIELAIRRAHYDMEQAKPVEKITELSLPAASEVLWDYENIKGDEELLRARLKALNWSDDRIELAVTRANLEIIKETAPKALTRSDYKDLYDATVIDQSQLFNAYVHLGYSETDATWLSMYDTVSIRYPDLKTLYANGWINAQDMYDELIYLGLPIDRAKELMAITIKYVKPERVAAEKALTKAEIIKGAKSGILDTTSSIALLEDLGYDENEAMYLLAINKVVLAGDPEGYWDMKKVTEAYKKALGQKSKTVPDDLPIYEARYNQLKKEVADLKAKGASDVEISDAVIRLADVEANYRKLMQEWERQP